MDKLKINLDADRADLTDPHRHRPMRERLADAGAIDLRDNHTAGDLGGGYIELKPIDPLKKITRSDDE